jgi:DNA-binding NtrC family response regulator
VAERILVVEDESALCHNIARALDRAGHSVSAVESVAAALAELSAATFDLVISDLRLPDGDGFAVLSSAKASSNETAVLIMTAYASVDSAVEALRRGAQDYILKPLSLVDLERKVALFAERRALGQENARLRSLVRGVNEPMSLLRAGGDAMQRLCDVIEKVAASPSTVLVQGESGSGKEIVARAIHEASSRREGPFVTLNVSAIPEPLIESYLFGHERGAFTGADKRREGLFRAASGGTLFLDEIGELPLSAQAKLLRAAETKEVLPVGSDRGVRVDARIIAATHRDLVGMADSGRFRSDLLYRLSVLTLRVPALRERVEDIERLAAYFVARHAGEQRKPVHGIAPDAIGALKRWPWRGNVRELSNVIERAVLLTDSDPIGLGDLPLELQALSAPDTLPPAASAALPQDSACELAAAVSAFERAHIARVLIRARGNREAAARLLGLSPATLYRHLTRLGLKGFRVSEPD